MPLLNIKQRKEYQKKYRLKNIDIIRTKDREYKTIQRLKFPEKIKEIKNAFCSRRLINKFGTFKREK